MTNKLTLLVDGNWLLISRMSVLAKGFQISNSKIAKDQTAYELTELLARSINVILNRFQEIDNMVIVSDGGSWRKQLPIPKCLENTIYKGNRTQETELDWDIIYSAFNNFFKHCQNIGITCTNHSNCEGDDWVWYWSRKLNSEGTHCIIWSSDNDLKQLIQVDQTTQAFTAWYNDKAGLWLPSSIDKPFDEFEFFMRTDYISPILESLKKKNNHISYINPNEIILNKILCGDAGDNIKSVIRYIKNGRTYRFSQKDYEKLINELDITNINDLLKSYELTAKYICDLEKFKKYNFKESDIIDMLKYNTKLVWLHEDVIPDTAIIAMNQQEYKQFDLNQIRSNFKILMKDDEEVKDIFESIFE